MTAESNPHVLHDPDEARELCRFLQQCHGEAMRPAIYHIGDIWWHLAFQPPESMAVWKDHTGAIEGFAWLEPPDGVMMHIRPDLRGQGHLEREMIDWAATAQPADEIWTRIFDSDAATVSWLLAAGFVRDEFSMIIHRRDMAEPIAASSLPEGFVVRHVRPDEVQERAEAHRDAFHPSRLTLENYLRGRAAPDYDPELDVVAVAPDGTIASYCIAWYDPANRLGYFEPVGTRAAFRGQRLGQAVLNEALRRLLARGARESTVAANANSAAARRLYQSVGFRDADVERLYGRKNKV